MKQRMRLYDFPVAFDSIMQRVEDLDGELPEFLEDELDALQISFEEKADAIAGLIDEANGEAEYFDVRAKRLTDKKRVASNRADRLKKYLHETMTLLGQSKVKTANFTVRIQANGQSSIRWQGDPEKLPEDFKRITIDLDGQKAQQALKDGTLPEGFDVSRGTHLRIV